LQSQWQHQTTGLFGSSQANRRKQKRHPHRHQRVRLELSVRELHLLELPQPPHRRQASLQASCRRISQPSLPFRLLLLPPPLLLLHRDRGHRSRNLMPCSRPSWKGTARSS
jgi:hypothetical protein